MGTEATPYDPSTDVFSTAILHSVIPTDKVALAVVEGNVLRSVSTLGERVIMDLSLDQPSINGRAVRTGQTQLVRARMRVVGIFSATVIWWVTVGLGYPSFICITLLAMSGVLPPNEVYAQSMGNWVVLFMIGCFGLTECLKATGVLHRFTTWFITRPFTLGRPWMMVAMLLLACTLLGSLISITATCILFMTMAASLLDSAGYMKGDRFAASLMMGIAWAAARACC